MELRYNTTRNPLRILVYSLFYLEAKVIVLQWQLNNDSTGASSFQFTIGILFYDIYYWTLYKLSEGVKHIRWLKTGSSTF